MVGHVWQQEPDGFSYFHVDYRHAGPEEALAVLFSSAQVLRGMQNARVLIEVEGFNADREWLAASKRCNHEVFGPTGTKAAVIGIAPIGRVILRGFNAVGGGSPTLPFPNRVSAMAWLRRV